MGDRKAEHIADLTNMQVGIWFTQAPLTAG
jgi:hypothetical protein